MIGRLLVKFGILALPFAVLLGFVWFLTVYLGEAMPYADVVKIQQEAPQRWLYGVNHDNPLVYKEVAIQQLQPNILMLGSSRTFHFGADLFSKDPQAFYNGGCQGCRLPAVEHLLRSIPAEQMPQVILLGLDLPWFNADLADGQDRRGLEEIDGRLDVRPNTQLVSTAKSVLGGRATWSDIFQRINTPYGMNVLGARAISDQVGFLGDGSYFAKWLLDRYDQQTEPIYTLYYNEYKALLSDENAPANYILQGGASVSETQLQALGAILQFCQQNKIQVIGFSLPFMPIVADDMHQNARFAYMRQTVTELETLFTRYGFRYVYVEDATALGATNDEFYDIWHPTRLLSARFYQYLLTENPDILGAYTDADALAEAISQAKNPMRVFGAGY